MPEAVRACLDGLSALGIDIPEHPTDEDADRATTRALAHLAVWGKAPSEVAVTTDPTARATCDLLAALVAPAAYTDWNLVWVAAATAVEWSLDHGNASSSPTGYAVLALRLSARGEYAEAYRLGEQAYRLSQREENVAVAPRTALLFLAFLSYLALPVHEVIDLLHRELDAAKSIGDLTHASYLQKSAIELRFFTGDALADVAASSREALAAAERAGYVAVAAEHRSSIALFDRLTRPEGAPGGHADSAGPAGALPLLSLVESYHDVLGCYLLGDVTGAADAADRVERLSIGVVGAIEAAELHFYAALAHAADPRRARSAALEKVRKHQEALHRLAQTSPVNFGARDALVTAESYRLSGDDLEAERCYETAIRAARTSASVPVEAIASERASAFHRARGMFTAADAYLVQAFECYEAWGAARKTQALLDAFPVLRAHRRDEAPDVQSLLEVQRAISSTYRPSDLHERLMAVALEHAGAQRGCLLLACDHDLVVATAAGSRADDFGPAGASAEPSRVPLSLCRTALRLRKPIVLADAREATRYAVDPYLARGTTRSVLCLPIVRGGEAKALVYLENDLVPGAFSKTRLVVLETIARQAAITLEKAQLISRLEAENAERRLAEEKLADHKRLLEDILDATPALVFVKDREGRFVLVNRRFEQAFHLDRRSFRGRSDADLFPPEKVDEFHASDLVVLSGRTVELDQRVALDDGDHAFMTIKFPLFDAKGEPRAICCVATDVSARKRAEEALRRSLSLVEAALESTADGILVVDLKGRIVRYNRQFTELWGLPDHVLGTGEDASALAFVLAQVQDPDAFVARVRELYASPDARSNDTILLSDGRVVERHSQPQRIGERVVGRVWSFRDVTARVRAAQEHDRLLAQETRARAEAEEAVRIRDEFLSIASHELRTPLASLSLAIDGLQHIFAKKDVDEPSRRALGIAKRQVGRLTSLIGVLLDVSRIRAGKLVLNIAEVDLRSVVRDATALLSEEMARAGSDLVLHADEPVVGRWDGVRLEQVVHNLVGNAIKFGGGLPITVSVGKSGEHAELSVEDRGIGIPPEFRLRLFEPFARGVSARHYGGLGLGLYITKTIVEAHGGELRVESEEGVGTKIIVQLPLRGP
jgi:PAS domain S-box-containing protein